MKESNKQKERQRAHHIDETMLRKLVRESLIREWTFIEALYMRPEGIIPGLISLVKDMFSPSTGERLSETGDDAVIREYQNFLGTLHLTPEYRAVWENYKQAQRRHASMDSDFDRAQDIRHPVGRAFNKLKHRVMAKFDELEKTLSPENRDIWEIDVEEQRQVFKKIFSDWERGKITTGRVLGMLDPKGIVENRQMLVRGLREAGEMVWGKDAVLMQLSRASNAIETALMDMEDVGCPGDSFAHTHLEQALDDLENAGKLGDTVLIYNEIIEILHGAQTAARNCREIDRDSAYRIARDIDAVEKEIIDWARSDNSGIEF